jgi:hypothetical protein
MRPERRRPGPVTQTARNLISAPPLYSVPDPAEVMTKTAYRKFSESTTKKQFEIRGALLDLASLALLLAALFMVRA